MHQSHSTHLPSGPGYIFCNISGVEVLHNGSSLAVSYPICYYHCRRLCHRHASSNRDKMIRRVSSSHINGTVLYFLKSLKLLSGG